jgi:hypothetical protein
VGGKVVGRDIFSCGSGAGATGDPLPISAGVGGGEDRRREVLGERCRRVWIVENGLDFGRRRVLRASREATSVEGGAGGQGGRREDQRAEGGWGSHERGGGVEEGWGDRTGSVREDHRRILLPMLLVLDPKDLQPVAFSFLPFAFSNSSLGHHLPRLNNPPIRLPNHLTSVDVRRVDERRFGESVGIAVVICEEGRGGFEEGFPFFGEGSGDEGTLVEEMLEYGGDQAERKGGEDERRKGR